MDKLVQWQEKEGLHAGTKITRRHINFHAEKMKVKLAAQTLSTRVADALVFMEMKFPDAFNGARATSQFCRVMNDIFDFLNSRTKYGKNESQNCITTENLNKMEDKVNTFIDYIKNLKIIEKGKEVSVLSSHKKPDF